MIHTVQVFQRRTDVKKRECVKKKGVREEGEGEWKGEKEGRRKGEGGRG